MATSVKMDERTKSRLEELQALLKLRTGRKVTPQELLNRLVGRAYESREAFVDSFRTDEDREGLSEEGIERWLSGTTDRGVETSEVDVDETLCGSTDESRSGPSERACSSTPATLSRTCERNTTTRPSGP